MKIKLIKVLAIKASHLPKIIARTLLLLSCTTIFGFSPNPLTSQNPKITIEQDRKVTIFEVFEIIGKQTECTFIYQSDIFKGLPKIELKKGIIKVNELLKQCLPLADYTIITTKDNHITITRRISNAFPQGNIKGVVTDSLGMGMTGVNIVIKNTTKGVQSDLEGKYSIIAHPSDTLVFTYMGYKNQEIAVENKTIINVVMQPDATSLDQVVINAGYYSVKNKERTGNISTISAAEIEKQPVNNPLAALQGRMSGVDIMETSGVPGSGFNVRIRGINSINAGNEPLYIIDGVPYDSRSLSSNTVSAEIIYKSNISPLNAINPTNIESMEVLKDADATAIYGSRGSNGVIIITTKKGKEGKTRFTISSSTSIASITRKVNLLNTQEYLNMRREAFANDGITEYPETAYDINGTWDPNRYTDWQKELIGRTAKSQSIQATISGGSPQTQFLLSGNYQKETTVFPGNFNYNRLNITSNLNHKSKDNRFNLLFNAGYTIEDNLLPKVDLSSQALLLSPNAPALYDENGQLNWENSTWTNPLASLQSIYKNNIHTLLSNAVLSYKFIPNLEAKVNLGYGINRLEELNTKPNTIFDPAFGYDSSSSSLFKNNANANHYILEPQLEWKHSFDVFKINALLGATYQKNSSENISILGSGFPNNSFIENLQSATSLYILNEEESVYSYQSFFSRLNLSLYDKIFINLTGRREGSSRFGPGNKYGNFGALGAAWLFSEELSIPWLSLGKLRASYGITGNDQIGDYQYLQSYSLGEYAYDGNIGLEPSRLFNPNFKWEETKKAEAALELGFWKNRISLNMAYYRNRSSNQLIQYALPATTGFTSILANLDAVVENKGFEVELEAAVIRDQSFSWNVGFNFTAPKNTLIEFPGLEGSPYANRFVIGESLSSRKLYKLNGVDPETGLFTFEDFNGDGEITSPEDRQYIADLSPKFYGGISNSFQYKSWGLDFLFQFVKKNATNQFYYSNSPGTMVNQPIEVLDRWQLPGDNSYMQQFSTGDNFDAYLAYSRFSQSDAAVSDASFIRLKSLDLSYTLPLDKLPNTSCKISLRGQNLLTFTKYIGGDPEQIMGLIPSLRRISLNLQLQF
ncbi:SusC/RagA family TonB-linked outer membrane protein [Aequorivita viscosa]|uniref:TonB-linked outer membrane protein, SusC/RagA family n=1 Tax=Aequorivita viscosa TaxID=797419 RepID=A0A1M6MI95_9FLAO|nr:TonB-dependent receptor [Aequorivita viscosa]SDX33981.1 TonB-linked outer membrane protein, SusC/RagA family [Aequorivita viscosa]SHJ83040.1 TonB-linked outer membrane protein, SusC/RagA family [Aequorivita viscosa]